MADKELEKAGSESVTIWKNGNPITVVRPIISKEQLEQIPRVELTEEYDGDDPKYQGKIKAEAMWGKLIDKGLDGDTGAIEQIMNRILGRPVQQNLNKNITMTYADALRSLKGGSDEDRETNS